MSEPQSIEIKPFELGTYVRTDESLDNLPDLGVKAPETEEDAEKMRQKVLTCVVEISKPDNYENFKTSAIGMFNQFGIQPDTGIANIEWNEARLRNAYASWQVGVKDSFENNHADIELRGPNKSYANIYLNSQKQFDRNVIAVCPGACCLPRPADVALTKKVHYGEKNFYSVFETTIGSDPYTDKDKESRSIFYVVEDKYFRVSAVDPLSELKEKL